MGETVTVMGYSNNPDAIRVGRWRKRNLEKARENSKKYYLKNREKICLRMREWGKKNRTKLRGKERMSRLSVNGKRIRIKKRVYPNNQICELCHKVKKRLGYHHWDDDKPEFGMWICIRCHHFVETLEEYSDKIVKEYNTLKEEIENG